MDRLDLLRYTGAQFLPGSNLQLFAEKRAQSTRFGATGSAIDPAAVAVYIRWSTDDQGEGTTLDVQRDACMYYGRSQGWEVSPDLIFIDDGYSGALLDRPGMNRLRELVRTRQVQCVIVNTIDRLSRNIVDAVSLVLKEWDGRCHIKCVKQPVDTTTELGRMIFGILAMFADFERSQIRARTFSGKVRRAEDGRNPGKRIPFGYQRGEQAGDMVLVPEQIATVRRIFELYASGTGERGIAVQLNKEGALGPGGRLWNRSAITYLLRNQVYIGVLNYGAVRRNRHREEDKTEPYYLTGQPLLASVQVPHLAIINQELWERVERRRHEITASVRVSSPRAVNSRHLLTGLAKCQCGHSLQGFVDTKQRSTAWYRCPGRAEKGPTFCDAGVISQKALDTFVVQAILQVRDPQVMERVLGRRSVALAAQSASAQAQAERCKTGLSRLDQETGRVRQDYLRGQLTIEEHREFRAELQGQREVLSAELAASEAELLTVQSLISEDGELATLLADIHQWEVLAMARKKQVLRQAIASLVAYRKANSDEPVNITLESRLMDPGESKAT